MNRHLLRTAGVAALAAAAIGQAAEWIVWLATQAGFNRFDAYDYSLGGDSPIFQAAATVLRDSPESLYDRAAIADAIARIPGSPEQAFNTIFVSPPVTAMPFLPIAGWSQAAGWVAVTVVGLAVAVAGLRRLGTPWPHLAAMALFAPVVMGLRLGQLALLGGGLLALAAAAVRHDRPFLAGALVGLLVVKPQYAVGVAIAWLAEPRRRIRELAGAATTALLVGGASAVAAPEAWRRFFTDATELAASVNNIGLLVHRFALASSISLLAGDTVAMIVTVFAIAALLVAWRRLTAGLDAETVFALAVVAGLAVSPYVVDYDWTLLVVPAVILWQRHPTLRPSFLPAAGAVAITAMTSRALAAGTYDVIAPDRALQIAPWVLLTVFVFLIRRLHATGDAGRKPEPTAASA